MRPAVLVLIKDSQLAEKFKQDFCTRRSIAIWRKGVDQQTVKYVIDSKYEKDAMEFEQSPFKWKINLYYIINKIIIGPCYPLKIG